MVDSEKETENESGATDSASPENSYRRYLSPGSSLVGEYAAGGQKCAGSIPEKLDNGDSGRKRWSGGDVDVDRG
jgi:hypothetical protein